ncbi:MAG TPA: hypothetical protein VKS44_10590 [Candidatus Acidoferrales bacterium]|nr:hypothetical protein [Candidatus Acidoferrales bacterium]
MNGNTNWAGEGIMMVNADQHRALGGSILAKSILLAAGLLIVFGIVLQLGVLGYGHVNPSNYWFLSVLTQGVWNLLSLHGSGSALGQIARFWPLVLVSVGLGILMLRLERP